ncbi:MAG TPA: hypothetical protein VN636_09325 [Acidimicrobiia bacterium]|jgi:hypothetical protein|nr:hypothetical protein [Acidimicrobiia bacterium]
MKKHTLSLVFGAILLALLPGCSTNTQGDDASPVFLQGSFTLLPLQKNVADNTPLQFSSTTLKNVLKAPSTSIQFLDVQVDSYTVTWQRIDGGKTASPTQIFGGEVSVPAGGSSTLNNYPYMSADSLIRPPLDQLFPYNGGIDHETGRAEIRQAGVVIWQGHTLSGQPVSSVPATFDMIFIYQGTGIRVQPAGVR